MTNKDKVYKYISENYLLNSNYSGGFTTQMIAQALGMKRSNASSILNQLYKQKLLVKSATRPVTYKPNNQDSKDPFSELIGHDSSLASAIKLAKAALAFPNGILTINLEVPKGCGARKFIQAFLAYAKQQKIISPDYQLKKLNCGLLKDNLEQKLFSTNLLDLAEDEVLLVQNYHELSDERIGQLSYLLERKKVAGNIMIFSKYKNDRAKVDADMDIVLPTYLEKPLEERYQLIASFFKDEVRNAKKDVSVSANSISALLLTDFKHGIKELRKVIVAAFATCYVRSIENRDSRIYVNSSDLPQYVVDSLVNRSGEFDRIEKVLANRDAVIFSAEGKDQTVSNYLYRNIDSEYQYLETNGYSQDDIHQKIDQNLKDLFIAYNFQHSEAGFKRNTTELSKIVPKELISLVELWLSKTESKLGIHYSDNIFYGICLHLNSLIYLGVNNREASVDEIQRSKKLYPNEFKAVENLSEILFTTLDFRLVSAEQLLVVMFLLDNRNRQQLHPQVLFVMHGSGIARELSKVVNTLLKDSQVSYYDMDFSKSSQEVTRELKELVLRLNEGAGVLVMYDMGSIKNIFDQISTELDIPIRLVNVPITLVGLEVARKASNTTDIDDVYHDIMFNLNRFAQNNSKTKPDLFITLCHTGEGGAVQLKDYLDQYSILNAKVVALSMSDRNKLADKVQELRKIYDVKAFVGTYNPNLFGIPYISTEQIFSVSTDQLDQVLSFIPITGNLPVFRKIYDYYSKELKYTRIDLLKEVMPKVMEALSLQYGLNSKTQIGVFTHIVGLIEASLAGDKRNLDLEANPAWNKDYSYISRALKLIENKFNIIIGDQEIYLIAEIVKQKTAKSK